MLSATINDAKNTVHNPEKPNDQNKLLIKLLRHYDINVKKPFYIDPSQSHPKHNNKINPKTHSIYSTFFSEVIHNALLAASNNANPNNKAEALKKLAAISSVATASDLDKIIEILSITLNDQTNEKITQAAYIALAELANNVSNEVRNGKIMPLFLLALQINCYPFTHDSISDPVNIAITDLMKLAPPTTRIPIYRYFIQNICGDNDKLRRNALLCISQSAEFISDDMKKTIAELLFEYAGDYYKNKKFKGNLDNTFIINALTLFMPYYSDAQKKKIYDDFELHRLDIKHAPCEILNVKQRNQLILSMEGIADQKPSQEQILFYLKNSKEDMNWALYYAHWDQIKKAYKSLNQTNKDNVLHWCLQSIEKGYIEDNSKYLISFIFSECKSKDERDNILHKMFYVNTRTPLNHTPFRHDLVRCIGQDLNASELQALMLHFLKSFKDKKYDDNNKESFLFGLNALLDYLDDNAARNVLKTLLSEITGPLMSLDLSPEFYELIMRKLIPLTESEEDKLKILNIFQHLSTNTKSGPQLATLFSALDDLHWLSEDQKELLAYPLIFNMLYDDRSIENQPTLISQFNLFTATTKLNLSNREPTTQADTLKQQELLIILQAAAAEARQILKL
jgi:hypothetical protein